MKHIYNHRSASLGRLEMTGPARVEELDLFLSGRESAVLWSFRMNPDNESAGTM